MYTGANIIDMVGRKCHSLTVIEQAASYKRARWRCQCDCGARIIVRGDLLRTGHTKSCGRCFRRLTSVAAASQQKLQRLQINWSRPTNAGEIDLWRICFKSNQHFNKYK